MSGLPGKLARLDRVEAQEILEDRGISSTQQRLEIASVLLARKQHLSADALIRLLSEGGCPVSKATVYNTLALFSRHGLVREVVVDSTKVFYDSNTHPHHHFYDKTTGELTDIGETDIELKRVPSPPEGASIEGIDVVVKIVRQI